MTSAPTVAPPRTPGQPRTKGQMLRSYDVADFPALTGREEDWRFTPLRRLRGLATDGVAAAPVPPSWEYGELPAGVDVSTVERQADPRVGGLLTPFDRVSALAFGRAPQVLRVQVERGAAVPGPAVVRVVGADSSVTTFGHTYVDVGELAEVTLVLDHIGSVTMADNVEVAVGAGARLVLVTIADWAADSVQAQHIRFRLDRDARVVHVQVALGGDLVRQYTSVEYAGRGAEAELYGIYFATGPVAGEAGPAAGGAVAAAGPAQHLEHRLFVDHAVPDCRSYVAYRGALQGESTHTVWVGDVLIRNEATGTDTYEINRNLLLSDGARADSVPNLEIETGEVVGAGHASATGRFDDEQLFYLMTRGIPEGEARRLVVRGFFAELLGKIPVPELRERLGEAIEDRLTTALGRGARAGAPSQSAPEGR